MASYQEKVSTEGSQEKVASGSKAVFVLDERRRAALAEVDNAKFSYVLITFFDLTLTDIF